MHRFDWGDGGEESCHGSGTFEQLIEKGHAVTIGTLPAKLENVRIQLVSDGDVDIQVLDGDGTQVVAWPSGLLNEAWQTTQNYKEDTITYSGYDGVGSNPGNEFVQFDGFTNRDYLIRVYGFDSGFSQVSYEWTGKVGCKETANLKPTGSGSFTQDIMEGSIVTVGDLPAGLSDVYIHLESPDDIDIQLYDEETPIVGWNEGIVLSEDSGFATGEYAGVEIQYSGYHGEQRPGTHGHEYIFLKGKLTRTLTLKVMGYAAGAANVSYHWGYYSWATSSDGLILRQQLHDIVRDHTEYSYRECWELLQRTDQDPDNVGNVRLLYSRKSVSKEDRDNGTGGDLWNREHVWAKSHGNFGTSPGPGTDLHALRASDASVNADRSAKDFDNGGLALDGPGSASDCPACLEDADSFEPPDEVKGDVARMLFYMSVRYDASSDGIALNIVDFTGTPYGSSTAGNGQIGKLSALKQWHNDDPPSDEEKHRNNLIFQIQGNRNPFVDNPGMVDKIF